jgi:hypothetical protein
MSCCPGDKGIPPAGHDGNPAHSASLAVVWALIGAPDRSRAPAPRGVVAEQPKLGNVCHTTHQSGKQNLQRKNARNLDSTALSCLSRQKRARVTNKLSSVADIVAVLEA